MRYIGYFSWIELSDDGKQFFFGEGNEYRGIFDETDNTISLFVPVGEEHQILYATFKKEDEDKEFTIESAKRFADSIYKCLLDTAFLSLQGYKKKRFRE